MTNSNITSSEAKKILDYDPCTGILYWKSRNGRIAGYKSSQQYISLNINRVRYAAHRIAWLIQTGDFPKNEIDHINGIRSDNRWENLREANRKQNCENRAVQKNNTSGYVGVYWLKNCKKWCARIKHNKKYVPLGLFDDKRDAAEAYWLERLELFTHHRKDV